MDQEATSKPAFIQYLKVAAVGSLAITLVSVVNNLDLVQGVPGFIIYIILFWIALKVYQTLLASWLGLEFRTATIFWYCLLAGVASVALGLGLVLLVFSLAFGIGMDSNVSQIFAEVPVYLLNVYIAALLFKSSDTCIPAWRPISNYWRPFYAGFKLTLGSKPQGPPQDQAKD